MKDDKPLIKTWTGGIFICIILLTILFFFFGLADRAEFFFENATAQGEANGLAVQPTNSTWPSVENIYQPEGAIAIALLAIFPLIGSLTVVKFTHCIENAKHSEDWHRRLINRLVAPLTAVWIFWIFFILFIKFKFGIEIIEANHISPIEFLGYGILTISIVAIILPFTYPLIPDRIAFTTDNVVINRYIDKQWRHAQVALSSGLAVVIAGSVPVAFRTTDWFGFTGMIFLVGTMLPPFMLVFSYLSYRIHIIESSNRR